MRSQLIIGSLLVVVVMGTACSLQRATGTGTANNESGASLIDAHATRETNALFQNLLLLSKNHTLFGHQHATEYGHGWAGDEDRSDVKSVTGSHPAVIGVDLSGFSGRPADAIQIEKERVRKIAQDTYNRGGVVTVAWHFNNPVSPGGFYWKD
ncbi:MAG TPA: glycosyl hydrolase, partial [Flavisolibacter sp.]|nr:glycosyl hydrolase [Flavisolibacter sp.]